MWSLHVRRRVLRDLLLHWWWRDVLLLLLLRRRSSGTSLPCPGHADARLALRGGSCANTANTTNSKCLLLLLLLRLGRKLLLILDWHGWWGLHWWWCLRLLLLLDLPSLCYLLLLLLLYHHLLLLMMLLLAIRIRHRVYGNVAMRVQSNTDGVWRSSAILSWAALVAGIDAPTAWGSRRCGRDASGSRVAEGWTA